MLPRRIGNWPLTSVQQRLVKTGGRVVKHARYYWLLLAESDLTRRPFAASCLGWRRYPRHRGRRKCWPEAELGGEVGLVRDVPELWVGKAAV